jgi:hypothetical protein
MGDRDYEHVADEYDRLNFYQAVSRFSEALGEISLGELMAMGGRFLELAQGDAGTTEDERATCGCLAQAVEEAIVFRLKGDEAGLQRYFEAKLAHLQFLDKYFPVAASSTSDKEPAPGNQGLSGWFGKRR